MKQRAVLPFRRALLAPGPLALALWLAASQAQADAPAVSSAPAQEAPVKIKDHRIFGVKVDRGDKKASERAAKATRVLEAALEEEDEPEVKVVEEGELLVVYVGKAPLIQLTELDAQAAGDASLAVHAATVSSRVKQELRGERQRNAAAHGVFSVSLLVFSGLLALLLTRKLDEATVRLRERLQEKTAQGVGLQLGGLDIIPPGMLQGFLLVTLSAGRVLLRVVAAYGWLVLALSRFQATRAWTERLTGALVAPLTELVKRMVTAAPLAVVLAVVGFVVMVFVRFLRVLFQGFDEGTNRSQLIPPDLAGPGGTLAQLGAVFVALVAVLPLVTGNDQGAAGRMGVVALVALGLGLTPLVAATAAGVVQIFGRRVGVGDEVKQGEHEGKVVEVNLLETRIEEPTGEVTRLPHLLGLMQTTTVRRPGVVDASVCVAADADLEAAQRTLREAAARHGKATAQLEQIDRDGALFAVRVETEHELSRGDLLLTLACALRAGSIALGSLPTRRS